MLSQSQECQVVGYRQAAPLPPLPSSFCIINQLGILPLSLSARMLLRDRLNPSASPSPSSKKEKILFIGFPIKVLH